MANEEQLSILKQGVDVWNRWRRDHTDTKIDLYKAHLRSANLQGANLHAANLSEAYLSGVNLIASDLARACLVGADLSEADLRATDLSRADLRGANLNEADLRESDLFEANLSQANLRVANLRMANLQGTNLWRVRLADTVLGNIDLAETVGLEDVVHTFPSTIGTDTLQRSRGKIPVEFLRGCGLSDVDIEYAKLYNPDLNTQEINDILYKIYDLRARQAIQVSPLFISYSRKDDAFVDQLEVELNNRGIRFWRDIHDAKAGRLETQIEQAIRHNPTVLLVLSESALDSDWVQHEVRKARGLEKELGRDVLCPVTLDNGWKSSRWPERVMEQVMEYNILDFSQWQDDAVFQRMFVKLLDGLQLFYKK